MQHSTYLRYLRFIRIAQLVFVVGAVALAAVNLSFGNWPDAVLLSATAGLVLVIRRLGIRHGAGPTLTRAQSRFRL